MTVLKTLKNYWSVVLWVLVFALQAYGFVDDSRKGKMNDAIFMALMLVAVALIIWNEFLSCRRKSLPKPPPIMGYEAHITIEPVFGLRFSDFDRICMKYSFRPAELLLMKHRRDTATRSNKDSFCTGHGDNFYELCARTALLVCELKDGGFAVWRYKVEGMLLDVRYDRLISIESKAA